MLHRHSWDRTEHGNMATFVTKLELVSGKGEVKHLTQKSETHMYILAVLVCWSI